MLPGPNITQDVGLAVPISLVVARASYIMIPTKPEEVAATAPPGWFSFFGVLPVPDWHGLQSSTDFLGFCLGNQLQALLHGVLFSGSFQTGSPL